MKKSIPAIIPVIASFTLSGCASVQFYSDSGLTQKTGLKVCLAKPYLLVENSSAKDKSTKTTLVWLPDQGNPQYVILKPGFGSNELKLAFTNGSLETYGITTENQIPETINSLASLISKTSDAAANFVSSPVPGQEPSPLPSFELYEIVIKKDRSILKRVIVSEEIR